MFSILFNLIFTKKSFFPYTEDAPKGQRESEPLTTTIVHFVSRRNVLQIGRASQKQQQQLFTSHLQVARERERNSCFILKHNILILNKAMIDPRLYVKADSSCNCTYNMF